MRALLHLCIILLVFISLYVIFSHREIAAATDNQSGQARLQEEEANRAKRVRLGLPLPHEDEPLSHTHPVNTAAEDLPKHRIATLPSAFIVETKRDHGATHLQVSFDDTIADASRDGMTAVGWMSKLIKSSGDDTDGTSSSKKTALNRPEMQMLRKRLTEVVVHKYKAAVVNFSVKHDQQFKPQTKKDAFERVMKVNLDAYKV